ncbi:DUF1572 domain-containing protein [Taibaiella lutea]|uniref:DUF1572 domain-containing protein n=1 Tax=Taibaiella lutea TaxID=2608001 RepID=A0A5M6CIL6_9BACT|nr:DinB family protein [Taibaiella lutea]KAA5533802.1 DUF1572 domain-containing protein [Taibaiella lutea]
MDIKQGLINELSMEAANTRKMLERVPADKLEWQPHNKSMPLRRLAVHVAELSNWPVLVVNDDELDFSKMDYKPPVITTTEELLDIHEKGVEQAVAAIRNMSDEDLMKPWTLRNGEHIIFQLPKIAVLRGMCFNHIYHHRGQLSVYLRLLDIQVPGMYGPSADEM